MVEGEFTLKYSKRFHNCFHLLIQLDYLERYLLDYLVEQCEEDGDGIVKTGQAARATFINFILRISNYAGEDKQIIYKDSSVKTALHTLRKLGFIINNSRGYAWINPLYYGRFNKNKRRNLMKLIAEELEPEDNALQQTKPNPPKLNFTPTEELQESIDNRNKELWGT